MARNRQNQRKGDNQNQNDNTNSKGEKPEDKKTEEKKPEEKKPESTAAKVAKNVLEEAGEIFSASMIFKGLSALWEFFSKNEKVRDAIVERISKTGKGLADENSFAEVFARAKFTKGKPGTLYPTVAAAKWKTFREALTTMQNKDRANNTKYVRNFRLIITTVRADDAYTVKVVNGAETREERNPNYIHPGIYILQDIAESCTTKKEFEAAIAVTGAIQDAPFGKLDEFQHWALKTFKEFDSAATLKDMNKRAKRMSKHKGHLRGIFGERIGGFLQRTFVD